LDTCNAVKHPPFEIFVLLSPSVFYNMSPQDGNHLSGGAF
jgi:hypothetical protein